MIASNDILSNPANVMPPMRTSLFYAARCEARVAVGYAMKSAEFLSGVQSRQMLYSPLFLAE